MTSRKIGAPTTARRPDVPCPSLPRSTRQWADDDDDDDDDDGGGHHDAHDMIEDCGHRRGGAGEQGEGGRTSRDFPLRTL